MTLLPRNWYDAKPTAESPNAIVKTPGVLVLTLAAGRAAAVADAASAAASSRSTTRFTGEPSSGPGVGTEKSSSARRKRLVHRLLSVGSARRAARSPTSVR